MAGECRRCLTGVRDELDIDVDAAVFTADPELADDPDFYPLPPRAIAVDVTEVVREELALAAQADLLLFWVGLLITAADVLIALALANYGVKADAKAQQLEQSGVLALAAQADLMLCREDCAGLCPRCGADLNAGPCGCHTPAEPV